MICESANATDMGLNRYETEKYMPRAITSGKTLLKIRATYYRNMDVYERNNPLNALGECDYDHNKWEFTEE